MNEEFSVHFGSACEEGPLINGHPALTIEVLQSWCRAASMPALSDSADQDFAKHVESLILRISKPVLNSNIGHLKKVQPRFHFEWKSPILLHNVNCRGVTAELCNSRPRIRAPCGLEQVVQVGYRVLRCLVYVGFGKSGCS
jgi:hypothetical protein